MGEAEYEKTQPTLSLGTTSRVPGMSHLGMLWTFHSVGIHWPLVTHSAFSLEAEGCAEGPGTTLWS